MKRLVVGVGGMSCQGCVKNLTGVLKALPGVADAVVSLENAQADITYDPLLVKPTQFKEAIEGAGFDVVCDGNCANACSQ